jgi:hypothetical protein
MNLVFSTEDIEPAKRYAAWQGAICDVYVNVDVESDKRSDYQGFIREARFGAITMTDVLLSEQRISRRKRHIAKLDKDCYYVEFVQQGKINVLQSGENLLSNAGVGRSSRRPKPTIWNASARCGHSTSRYPATNSRSVSERIGFRWSGPSRPVEGWVGLPPSSAQCSRWREPVSMRR